MITKTKKHYHKKADFNTVSGKLFLQQQSGKSDSESARAIGITPESVPMLESTSTYKACVSSFKDALLNITTPSKLANELLKNIEQDADKGAKNNAIKIAMDKIEPDKIQQQAQMVNIVLK